MQINYQQIAPARTTMVLTVTREEIIVVQLHSFFD
jgi:hypothetical protein